MKHFFTTLFVLFPFIAQALPTPRSLVSINRPTVELRDLFEDVGSNADRIVGPGPAPGHRIEVGTAQLAKIAKQFGIVWQQALASTGVVINRPGSPVPQTAIKAALVQALRVTGAPPHPAVILVNFLPPMIPPEATATIMINRIVYDPTMNSFQAALLIAAPGMNPETTFVTGFVRPTIEAVIATHSLTPGEILGSADVATRWIPANRASPDAVTDPITVYGMQTKRAVTKGASIPKAVLTNPQLIVKGDFIIMAVQLPGLNVTARGIALASGSKGTTISVLNPASHDVVQAVVTGPGTAKVDPDSSPVMSTTGNRIIYGATGSYYTERQSP